MDKKKKAASQTTASCKGVKEGEIDLPKIRRNVLFSLQDHPFKEGNKEEGFNRHACSRDMEGKIGSTLGRPARTGPTRGKESNNRNEDPVCL